MAKQTWVNVNGAWRKVKSAWLNVNGVWKRDAMPKGIVAGNWKDFMSYYEPLIFVNTGIEADGSYWLSRFDSNLSQIFKVNIGSKPTAYNSLAYTFLSDDNKSITNFMNYMDTAQKLDVGNGSLIGTGVGGYTTSYLIRTQMYRYGNLLFHQNGGSSSFVLYVINMNNNSKYCPSFTKTGTYGLIKGIVADNSIIYLSLDNMYRYNSSLYKFAYSTSGISQVVVDSIPNQDIRFFAKVGYKVFCNTRIHDTKNQYVKSVVQIRNGGDLKTVEKEIDITSVDGDLSSIYDSKNKVIQVYSPDNKLTTMDLDGNIIATKSGVLTSSNLKSGVLRDCDESGNLYFAEVIASPTNKLNLVITDRFGNILKSNVGVVTAYAIDGINITASRNKNRYGEV